jgi:4-amino-4-deoxy-L-arabinose transferase-like glycosyltransferase
LLLLFFFLAFVYLRSFPPFEGPDEPQHFAYITWLRDTGRFPPQGDAAWKTPIEQEAGQPPLYYLLATLVSAPAGEQPPAEFRPNPHFIGPFPRDHIDNDHRAIRHPDDARPLAGGWLALYLSRGLTLGFGLLLVTGVYLLGQAVWPETPSVGLFAAALVAFTPQVLFLSSVVSNDIPAAALSTLTLWRLAVLMRKGFSPGRAVAVGLLFGFAVLAKVSAFTLALPITAGLLWLLIQHKKAGKPALINTFLLAGSAFLVAGWWFIRNWVLFGSPLGLTTHDRTSWAIRDPADLATPLLRWLEVFRSYWAGLGWGTIRPPGWVYAVLGGLVLVALAGLLWGFLRWWRRPRRTLSFRPAMHIVLALAPVAVMLFLEIWMRRVSAPYGRLLFPAVGASAVLLAGGWHLLHRRLPLLPVGFMLILAVAAPLVIIPPAYTPAAPVDWTAESAAPGWLFLAADGTPVAELVRVAVLEDNVETNSAYDQTLPVELCWRARAQTEQPVTVFVHIIGPENELVANRRTYPGLGLRPTHLWTPGEVYCDLTRVLIRTERVTKTLAYLVEVGILDEATDERLAAIDQQGNPLRVTFTGRVRLAAPNMTYTPIITTDPFVLLDGAVSTSGARGTTLPFTLTWGLAQDVQQDYQVFVHLRDYTGEIAAQSDGPPLAGWYPTSWWSVGETVTETRALDLPAGLAPGHYELVVGFYDLDSGQRIGHEQPLGPIEVLP